MADAIAIARSLRISLPPFVPARESKESPAASQMEGREVLVRSSMRDGGRESGVGRRSSLGLGPLQPRYTYVPSRGQASASLSPLRRHALTMSDSIYRRLDAWKKAMRLTTATYAATQSFPRHELYGLTSQMRRAAVSIPSNIAEGRGRDSRRDFRQFVIRARASAYELQTQITVAESLQYLSSAEAGELIEQSNEVVMVINGLIRHLT
jgi:four helix bundle protein